MFTYFPILGILYPTCASFGPFFLIMGVFFRTSTQRQTHPRTTNALLVVGGVMLTICLFSLAPVSAPPPVGV